MAAVMTIFTIMLSDFFDTMGTVIGVGGEGGWLDVRGQLPRINRVLWWIRSALSSEVSLRRVLLRRILRAPLVWQSVDVQDSPQH